MSVETVSAMTTEAYGMLEQLASNPDFDTKAMFEKLDGEKVSGSFDIRFGSDAPSSELKLDLSDEVYERSATITDSVVGGNRVVHVSILTQNRETEDRMAAWVSTSEQPVVKMIPGFIDDYPLEAEIRTQGDLSNSFLTMGLDSFPELVLDFRNTVNALFGDGIDK